MTGDFVRVSADQKCCPRCSVSLPLDAFGISRARKDGRNIYCKQCNRDRTNASRQSARERQEKLRGVRVASASAGGAIIDKVKSDSRTRFQLSSDPLTRTSPFRTPVERVREAIRSGPKTQKEILEETRLSKDEIGDALADLLLWLNEVGTHTVGDTRLYFLRSERDMDVEIQSQTCGRSDFDTDVPSFSTLPFFVPGKAASAG